MLLPIPSIVYQDVVAANNTIIQMRVHKATRFLQPAMVLFAAP